MAPCEADTELEFGQTWRAVWHDDVEKAAEMGDYGAGRGGIGPFDTVSQRTLRSTPQP